MSGLPVPQREPVLPEPVRLVSTGYRVESGFAPTRKPMKKEQMLTVFFFVTCVLNVVFLSGFEFGMQRGAALTLVVKGRSGGKNHSSRSLRKLQIKIFDCVYFCLRMSKPSLT